MSTDVDNILQMLTIEFSILYREIFKFWFKFYFPVELQEICDDSQNKLH